MRPKGSSLVRPDPQRARETPGGFSDFASTQLDLFAGISEIFLDNGEKSHYKGWSSLHCVPGPLPSMAFQLVEAELASHSSSGSGKERFCFAGGRLPVGDFSRQGAGVGGGKTHRAQMFHGVPALMAGSLPGRAKGGICRHGRIGTGLLGPCSVGWDSPCFPHHLPLTWPSCRRIRERC